MNMTYFNRNREYETRKLVPVALISFLAATFIAIPVIVSAVSVGISNL